MQNEYYRDFYQRAILPAGELDKKAFLNLHPDLLHSHLLIGLQGRPADNSDFYLWNVSIFSTNACGIYDACTPVYSSSSFDRFDDAVMAARNIEEKIRNDQFHAVRVQEKIS